MTKFHKSKLTQNPWSLLQKSFKCSLFTCATLFINFRKKILTKKVQKQPSRGALSKRCSKNMRQIYRRTPMPKCDFNNVALQLLGVLPHFFRTPFTKNTSERLLLKVICKHSVGSSYVYLLLIRLKLHVTRFLCILIETNKSGSNNDKCCTNQINL